MVVDCRQYTKRMDVNHIGTFVGLVNMSVAARRLTLWGMGPRARARARGPVEYPA
jgi:hypothetical protein